MDNEVGILIRADSNQQQIQPLYEYIKNKLRGFGGAKPLTATIVPLETETQQLKDENEALKERVRQLEE